MRTKSADTVLVGATDPRAREARTIDNYVKAPLISVECFRARREHEALRFRLF